MIACYYHFDHKKTKHPGVVGKPPEGLPSIRSWWHRTTAAKLLRKGTMRADLTGYRPPALNLEIFGNDSSKTTLKMSR